MTSEGLGEMFEGDSSDMRARKFSLILMGGPSGGSRVRRPGSEDPHRRERNCLNTFDLKKIILNSEAV
jgi:hypothetical protein